MTLLDSNVIVDCLKGREPVASRFREASPGEIAIPSIVAYEIEYGSLKIQSIERSRIVAQMIAAMQVVPFDRAAAHWAAKIRFDLERIGAVIRPLDLLIAGTAMSRGAALATNNVREFSRVEGLRIEDWSEGARIGT